jgi:hypothetical protein
MGLVFYLDTICVQDVIACEASYLQWYSTQESEESNWLLRITLTTDARSLIGCSKTESGDLIKRGTSKSSREIRSCDFARAPPPHQPPPLPTTHTALPKAAIQGLYELLN